jgi:hypothetical protein
MQNTGEGGIADPHRSGGDLVWQIGTGYFGCRDDKGNFSLERMLETLASAKVRALEIKLSQGAKPGLGGVLPAAKITPEISKIRLVPMGRDCISPASHAAFSDIYLLNEKLLSTYDVVTLFHLCEFRGPQTDAYGGMTDLAVTNLLTDRTRPGGHILFYTSSFAFAKAEHVGIEGNRTLGCSGEQLDVVDAFEHAPSVYGAGPRNTAQDLKEDSQVARIICPM